MNIDDPILTASEALKAALLSALGDEDASDEEVLDAINTNFEQYNEHMGKLLVEIDDGAFSSTRGSSSTRQNTTMVGIWLSRSTRS